MKCGLGIRPELFNQVLEQKPQLGFLEAHSENYFGESLSKAKLMELREHYPVTLHGVGLSLGRADDLDRAHLRQLKQLADEVEPMIVSEHLAWSAYSHRHIPDLLPLPLTEHALDLMCKHIDDMQQALGRQVLVENPSNYLVFDQLQIPEPEFLNTLAARTGCGLLVDVNNIHVSAINIGRDPNDYIAALDSKAIGQYHLAGYTEVQKEHDGKVETLLIDTHNHQVYDPVWKLFEATVTQHGSKPTLFEWDSDFPELEVLLAECQKADACLEQLQASDSIVQTASIELHAQARVPELGELVNFQTAFLDDVCGLSAEHSYAKQGQEHRISVYQNNLFGAMQEYLAEVYPATQGVVGDAFFSQMAQVLVQLTPPSEGNVHNYGAGMVEVLTHFEGLSGLPYLPDLVRYEWALHDAYYSTVSDVIDPATIPQEELLSLSLELNESVSLIQSDFPIAEIHRQSLPDFEHEISISLDQSQDNLLIYKQEHRVFNEVLSEPQLMMLQQVHKLDNLLQAIEALSGSIEGNELSACLSFLFEKQLLRLAPTEQPNATQQNSALH